jgi:hypothetical protein
MKKVNIPLLIGIALPIVFIIIISLVLFLPTLGIQPEHDFIYSSEGTWSSSYYQFKNVYLVKDDRIILASAPPTGSRDESSRQDKPILYKYNVKDNSVHQITYEEAQQYTLDPGPSSSDGYLVKYEYNHDGLFEIFDGGNSDQGYYIEKENAKKRLNGLSNGYPYSSEGNFKFLGWIK